MREFIRHPNDIPITFELETSRNPKAVQMSNIGTGGLCFNSKTPLEKDTVITIEIQSIKKFKIRGVVAWSRKENQHFEIGVKFLDEMTEFRVRNIEQVCYIEHYRKQVWDDEKRELSFKEAGLEWIQKFAKDFPA